jgi:hypothetical protein
VLQTEQERVRRVPKAALVEFKEAHYLIILTAPRAPSREPSSAPPRLAVGAPSS